MKTAHWISVLALSLAVAAPAQAAASKAPVKPAAKKAARAVAKTAAIAAPAALPVAAAQPLSGEQLAIADKVHVGRIPCELSAHVTVTANPNAPGRFVLEIGHQRYAMEPVVTSTGAVRLEDTVAGAVWLQLANKSMLMNQKLGKRIADECMSADQQVVAQALARSPAPSLRDPPKPVPATATE